MSVTGHEAAGDVHYSLLSYDLFNIPFVLCQQVAVWGTFTL